MLTQKQFIQQLTKLVEFPSLTGDVEVNGQALDYIESLISPQAKVQRLTNGQAEILLASNVDSLEPEFGYMVHVDVVAGSDSMFKLRQDGDLVFGRGVSDMKFSIPIGIALLNELLEAKSTTSFTLAITTDEEVGGFEGAAFLAKSINWRPKALIVPDGGDNLQFVEKAKGVAQFEITSKGTSAHASRPWMGKNALPSLGKLVAKLDERYGQNNLAESWETTLNFGQLVGGISTNQVCDSAVLRIDFRYPETNSLERIENEVRNLIEEIDPALESLTMKKLSTGLPTFTDVRLPVVKRFLSTLEAEYGQSIKVAPTFGASDARHFAAFNIPVLMIKPLGGDIHMESEYLDVPSTMTFYEALRKFVQAR